MHRKDLEGATLAQVATSACHLSLQSRGPGTDPCRTSIMARKWLKKGFSDHFSNFPGHYSPISHVRPKSMFGAFSSPFRAGGPKWICTRSTGLQTSAAQKLRSLGLGEAY